MNLKIHHKSMTSSMPFQNVSLFLSNISSDCLKKSLQVGREHSQYVVKDEKVEFTEVSTEYHDSGMRRACRP